LEIWKFQKIVHSGIVFGLLNLEIWNKCLSGDFNNCYF